MSIASIRVASVHTRVPYRTIETPLFAWVETSCLLCKVERSFDRANVWETPQNKGVAGAGRPPFLPVVATFSAKLLLLPLAIPHKHAYVARPRFSLLLYARKTYLLGSSLGLLTK